MVEKYFKGIKKRSLNNDNNATVFKIVDAIFRDIL